MTHFVMLPLLPKLSEAACKDYAFADVFFPEGKREEAKVLPFARSICGGCPETKACLEFALEQKIPHGIWAGTTPAQRKEMAQIPASYQMETTVADRIRELTQQGKSPQQIARLLSVEISYVKLALTRTAKNKGEIQLQTTTKNLLDDSYSSSESA